MSRLLPLVLLAALVSGHSEHSFDLDDQADIGMSYAERHVSRPSLSLFLSDAFANAMKR